MGAILNQSGGGEQSPFYDTLYIKGRITMPYSTSNIHHIISRYHSGEDVASLAKSSGVSCSMIYRWLKEEHAIETNEKFYSPHDTKALERKILNVFVELRKN